MRWRIRLCLCCRRGGVGVRGASVRSIESRMLVVMDRISVMCGATFAGERPTHLAYHTKHVGVSAAMEGISAPQRTAVSKRENLS